MKKVRFADEEERRSPKGRQRHRGLVGVIIFGKIVEITESVRDLAKSQEDQGSDDVLVLLCGDDAADKP